MEFCKGLQHDSRKRVMRDSSVVILQGLFLTIPFWPALSPSLLIQEISFLKSCEKMVRVFSRAFALRRDDSLGPTTLTMVMLTCCGILTADHYFNDPQFS